jgi:hypothetical protein
MRSGRGQPVFDLAGDGLGAISPTAQVKAAVAAAASVTKRRDTTKRFAFDHVTKAETAVAPLLGIYLGFSVARLHERFPELAVPNLLFGMMAIMLMTVALAMPSAGWKAAWKNSMQLRLVALLGALGLITAPIGIWLAGSLSFFATKYTISIGVFIACLLLCRDIKVMRRVVGLYVAITTVVAAVNVTTYFSGDLSGTYMTGHDLAVYEQSGVYNVDKARQKFGSLDPNDIAAVMATTVPLALWLAVGNLRRRVLWTPCAIVLTVAVIPTASRGGLLGLVGVAVVLVIFGASGGKRWFMIGTLALGAAAFMVLAGSSLDRMDEMGGTDYNYNTSEGRIAIWKRGLVWMARRPWGFGLDNFPVYFGWLNGPDRAAHNSLIQYGVELGVLGLAAYLLCTWTLIKSLLAVRKLAVKRGRDGQDTVALCGHALATLAASFISGFFLSHAYYPLTYMALGLGAAVVLSSADALKAAAPEPLAAAASGPRRRYLKAFDTA